MKLPQVSDLVNRTGTDRPTGRIEAIFKEGFVSIATVNWGTADNKTFRNDIPVRDLVVIEHEMIIYD